MMIFLILFTLETYHQLEPMEHLDEDPRDPTSPIILVEAAVEVITADIRCQEPDPPAVIMDSSGMRNTKYIIFDVIISKGIVPSVDHIAPPAAAPAISKQRRRTPTRTSQVSTTTARGLPAQCQERG